MLLVANPKSIEIQAKLFRGFSDPSRLSILDALQNGARTGVNFVVSMAGMSVGRPPADRRRRNG